ncbi:DUF4157 domain-containing protein [Kribbella sp. NBC_00482]|uniref:eCIS core domain-containing protein n=1 Tax=Kribbella sp. NBC_00482 TaxID=2975968 RepID=UPI002E16C646
MDSMDGTAQRPETLGERLAVLAEYLRLRHAVGFAWAPGFAAVLERLDAFDDAWAGRFERYEGWEDLAQHRGTYPTAAPAGPRSSSGPAAAGTVAAAVPSDVGAVTGSGVAPEPRKLPVDVRARLRDIAGPGADRMRVRIDANADAEARSQHADAVTVGTTVKVRSGQFRPDTAEGLGLLAHEASHVTALLARGAAARRNTPYGVAAEETVAARVERLGQQSPALSHPAGAAPVGYDAHAVGPTHRPHPGPQNAAVPSVPSALTPMRADADRPEAAPAPALVDADGLRHSIVEELMRRLRTDSERGG